MEVSPQPDRVIKKDEELILIGSAEGESQFSNRYEKDKS
jgi:K+/H+ antiporter YhaU regulatory subunit KhtT